MHEETHEAKAPAKANRNWLLIVFVAAIVLLVAVAGILAYRLYESTAVSIPSEVSQKVDFPIYLPRKLPGNFEIVETSFSFQEQVLLFTAKDSTGATITFAEQKRKPDFNFTDFHNTQIKDAQTLSNVPFPSVWGKAKAGPTRVLSIVTDKTWVFVSSPAPLSQEDMQLIATGLRLSR